MTTEAVYFKRLLDEGKINKELVEFLMNHDEGCEYCTFDFASDDCNKNSCKEGIEKWLESRAGELPPPNAFGV